jgi:DNA-binding NarL/FixJ family response regulator
MFSVSLLEDAADYRETLAAILAAAPGIVLLDVCATGEEALEAFAARPPQLALMDLQLPGIDGIECIRRLRPRLPDTLFLTLTSSDGDEMVFGALQAGAVGYLLKSTPAGEILAALRDALAGGSPMSPAIARRVVRHFSQGRPSSAAPEVAKLSPRETEVLSALARGLRYKEIAEQLAVGEETVRTHVRRLYLKLEVTSRTEAVLKFKGR